MPALTTSEAIAVRLILYTLSHLDGYATLSNVPENLGFLNRLAKGEKLEITFAEEVTELKPGDLALEINHGQSTCTDWYW